VAREQVVRIICDRCGREEFLPPPPPVVPEDPTAPEETDDLELTYLGKTIRFKDLCSSCKKTCGAYVDSIGKDVKSSRSKARKKRE
jgi:hypothetical protein